MFAVVPDRHGEGTTLPIRVYNLGFAVIRSRYLKQVARAALSETEARKVMAG